MTSRRTFISAITAALGGSLYAADGSPKRIVLQSAWDTVNIGDIGHTPGTLHILEQHLPELQVTVWAMKLDERVTEMLKRRFPKVTFLQGNVLGSSAKDVELQDAIKNCDLYIRNSGMGQDTTWIKFCRKVGKPYGMYGQSYFKTMVSGEKGEENMQFLNEASFIYTRESRTLKMLQEAGVKAPVLEFAPDGCFGIDVRDEERGLATMKKLGLEDRKFITVLLRTNTPKAPGVDDPRPEKLNPLHPTPQQVQDDERRAAGFRELITKWVKATGNKVLIAPETIKEMGHNKRLIFDPLPEEIRSHVVNLEYFWNADEAASIFARAHTVVCHEPHSPIIALANGTPIIHWFSEFHGLKCWMFEDIGLKEWLLEIDTVPAEKVFQVVMANERDYPAALAKVKKAMDFVHQRQSETMKVVKKVVG
ncbi:Polysaccharide pyruvyl transferase family protein WcaK [Prosthecobacter debontii]|uniref:Polysaccharide pyruvyl transferase family protein WcaK n=2 Tax=Prosthecobacter debontii TaxID=48467 RepID=A0A1T4Z3C6_9BACT|nr:Polysaccharide pyruvyl transferase family protein WcaK [Prosthecobacter debontii]